MPSGNCSTLINLFLPVGARQPAFNGFWEAANRPVGPQATMEDR